MATITGEKKLLGNWVNIPLIGKTKSYIVDDIMLFDVIRFFYRAGVNKTGHDKKPQLFVLSQQKSDMPDDHLMHGINLHYVSQSDVDGLCRFAQEHFTIRDSDPQFVVEMLLEAAPHLRGAYRKYVIDKMTIRKFESLVSFENIKAKSHITENST